MTKKKLLSILLVITGFTACGQTIVELFPALGYRVDKSPEGETEFNRQLEKCGEIWGRPQNTLDEDEKELWLDCNTKFDGNEDYWEIFGPGCSWYCGGGMNSVSASSELAPQRDIKYTASNAHDLSYKTAWVEGVPGYGIGEYLLYHVQPENPRITEIIVVNGYVKSDKAWRENSRVKKLKMYIDDKPYAILNLSDTKAEQHFKIEPLGVSKRDNWDEMSRMPVWTMKFEIADVYHGDKYDDVAITEIYFDGIDVHCLAKGTEIALADGSTGKIEDLQIGDFVMSWNETTNEFQPAQVKEIASPVHSGLVTINFSDGTSLTCTKDHPLKSKDGQWISLEPEKSMACYEFNHVGQLEIGDEVMTAGTPLRILSVEVLDGFTETYTIVRLDRNNAFIANGVVVGTEKERTHHARRHRH